MPFILKINVRSSKTGPPIRTIRQFNNFVFSRKFNSLASAFSFDFYFDPKDQNSAEIICVSHVHECILYYTTNKDPNYQPLESEREYTGYLLRAKFKNNGQPQFVKLSGTSKAARLNRCDFAPEHYPLEIDGLTLRQIIKKSIEPFGLSLVSNKRATAIDKKFDIKDVEEQDSDSDDEEGEVTKKTAAETSENVGSYLAGLAKLQNVVLSHNSAGNVYITTPNTKGKPILTFDFTDPANEAIKIPGLDIDLDFNAEMMHSSITVKQQSDDEEGSDGQEATLRNPLLPVEVIIQPRVISIASSGETTVNQAVKYELGKEIREAIPMKIKMGIIEIGGKLVAPNNTVNVKSPDLYLYKLSTWFIEALEIIVNGDEEYCTLDCVLPFGYDFDEGTLVDVFVDPHKNFGEE